MHVCVCVYSTSDGERRGQRARVALQRHPFLNLEILLRPHTHTPHWLGRFYQAMPIYYQPCFLSLTGWKCAFKTSKVSRDAEFCIPFPQTVGLQIMVTEQVQHCSGVQLRQGWGVCGLGYHTMRGSSAKSDSASGLWEAF